MQQDRGLLDAAASDLMETFGIGVVGSGIMGPRMIASLDRHPRLCAAALCDARPEALAQAHELAPAARVALDLQDLLADPAVDAVCIASPPAHHLAGVRAAAAAGKPVLCEKPLAVSVAEAQALRDLVAGAALRFAVSCPFARFSRPAPSPG